MRTIAVLLLSASMAGAAVLKVGPINLTGTGTYFDPDWNPDGGEGLPGSLGIGVNASGTNGRDTVLIGVGDVGVQYYGGADYLIPASPIFRPSACFNYSGNSVYPNCHVTIDGIEGFGTFTNIGGGAGLAQVYEYVWDSVRHTSQPGQLLAEAQIVSYVNITSVKYNYPPPQDNVLNRFTATFDVAPVTHMPEPGGIYLIFTGMAFIGAKLSRRKQNARQ